MTIFNFIATLFAWFDVWISIIIFTEQTDSVDVGINWKMVCARGGWTYFNRDLNL